MTRFMVALIAGLLLLVTSSAFAASGDEWVPPGPAVGTLFPVELGLPDQTDRRRTLADLMGTRGIALVFVRSADWCPFCKRQLAELNARAGEFQALGFPLVSVSVDTVPLIQAFAAQVAVRYTMLADPNGEINESLGIRDTQYPVGSAAFGVPQPGIFLIDRNRRIVGKFFEKGFRTRPDPQLVLQAIRALEAEAAPAARKRRN